MFWIFFLVDVAAIYKQHLFNGLQRLGPIYSTVLEIHDYTEGITNEGEKNDSYIADFCNIHLTIWWANQ